MSAPLTMGHLAGLSLRASCRCGHEAALDAGRIDMMMGDVAIGALRRAMRCGGCRKRSRPMIIVSVPPPRPRNLFDHPLAKSQPTRKTDMITRGFQEADRINREKFERIHGKLFELAVEDRLRLLEVRAMLGWAND